MSNQYDYMSDYDYERKYSACGSLYQSDYSTGKSIHQSDWERRGSYQKKEGKPDFGQDSQINISKKTIR